MTVTVPAGGCAQGNVLLLRAMAGTSDSTYTPSDSKGNPAVEDAHAFISSRSYSIMRIQLDKALSPGDVITVTLGTSSARRHLVVEEFDDEIIGVDGEPKTANGTGTEASASKTPSGSASAWRLWFGSVVKRGNGEGGFSQDADETGSAPWASLNKGGGDGGAGTGDWMYGGYKSKPPTNTTQIYNPTFAESVTWAEILVCYQLRPEYTRHFNAEGEGDNVIVALGETPKRTAATYVALIRKQSSAGTVFGRRKEGNSFLSHFNLNLNATRWLGTTGFTGLTTESWILVVGTKAAGTTMPRHHYYDFVSKEWHHTEPSEGGPISDEAAGAVDIRFGGKSSAVGPFKGDIAAAAIFDYEMSDKEVESLVEVANLGEWGKKGPKAAWFFNQGKISEPVADLTGGGADETSHSGTSVLEESPPPIPYGELSAPEIGLVSVLVGGKIVQAKRWVLVAGKLVRV